MRFPISIVSSRRAVSSSALFRRFDLKTGNLPYDFDARAFRALDFLFGLALVLRDTAGELKPLTAFLALKFVLGHAGLLISLHRSQFNDAEGMPRH
jgi:hypothetical protein